MKGILAKVVIEQFLKVCVKVNLVSGRKDSIRVSQQEGKGEPSETTEAGNENEGVTEREMLTASSLVLWFTYLKSKQKICVLFQTPHFSSGSGSYYPPCSELLGFEHLGFGWNAFLPS